jgi:putative DNA primase/helicase
VIHGTDEAIWDRLPLIPFPVRFADPRQESLPEGNALLRPMDRSLAEALMQELPGILAWAVAGCLQWQKVGLAIPEEVLQASRHYREESDFIQAFMDESTVRAFGMRCRVSFCHQRYMQWAANNVAPVLSQRKLSPLIEAKGFSQTRGTEGHTFWEGFGLQDD